MPLLIPEITKVVRTGTRFISCQNGLGNEDFLAEAFGADNVLRIVVNYGGGRVEPDRSGCRTSTRPTASGP